jgi:O-antigen/teichoic acid export membrane protein
VGYIKQLAGQTMVYGVGIVVPRLLNYVLLTPFYTRIFTQEQYGVVTELYAYVLFLLVILTYGMETGFFRFADKNNNKNDVYKTSLLALFSTSGFFILLVLLFINPISETLGYANNSEFIKWIAIIVAIDAFTAIPFAKLRLQNKAMLYTGIRIAEITVSLVLNWFFLYYCPANYEESAFIASVYNPEIGVGYVFLSNLYSSLLKLIFLLPVIFVQKGIFDLSLFKRMLSYSYPLLIAGLAGTVNEALDRILIKHLTEENSMAVLGIYGANYKLAVIMTLFIQMFRFAAEPFFLNKKDDSNARVIYAEVMNYFIFAGMIIFMLVIFFLPWFSLFIGVNFREGLNIVPIILMANLFMGIFYNLSLWYKVNGKTSYGAWFVISGAVITILINLIFIPTYGYIACAWAHFFSYLFMVIICYYYGQKFYPVQYNLKKIAVFFLFPLCGIFLRLFVFDDNSAWHVIISLVFLLIYVLIFIKMQSIKFNSIWKLK